MKKMEIHSIKKSRALLVDELLKRSRFLIIGPLLLERKLLDLVLKKEKPDLILFIDGGLKHRKKFSLLKEKALMLSVGDGDSSNKNAHLDFNLPAEKDFSDLAFALSALNSLKKNQIASLTFLGFSGKLDKRPDHLFFNVGEIARFVQSNKILTKMDRFFFYPPGKHVFFCKGIFSLMSMRAATVRLNGRVSYPLKDWTTLTSFSSRGLSNEASGKVMLENIAPVIVYLAGENIRW